MRREAAGHATLASVTGGRLTIRRRPSPGALLAPADGASGRSFYADATAAQGGSTE